MTNRCGTGSSKHLKLHVWYFWSYSCSQSVKYAKSQIVLKVFRRVLTFPPMGQAGWCSLSRRGYGFVLVGEAWSVIFICPFKFSYCYQLVLPCLNSCLPGRSKSNLSTAFFCPLWQSAVFAFSPNAAIDCFRLHQRRICTNFACHQIHAIWFISLPFRKR